MVKKNDQDVDELFLPGGRWRSLLAGWEGGRELIIVCPSGVRGCYKERQVVELERNRGLQRPGFETNMDVGGKTLT